MSLPRRPLRPRSICCWHSSSGNASGSLGARRGMGQRPRVRQGAAGAMDRVLEEIARAKRRLKLAPETAVVSCYEAGRDGFWIHRWLVAQGVTNYVVDSSSIEVNRRARRAKTDRLDLAGLLNLLARYLLRRPAGVAGRARTEPRGGRCATAASDLGNRAAGSIAAALSTPGLAGHARAAPANRS